MTTNETDRGWFRRIGPGIITAAVVLGPGSILAASRAGAEFGYSLIWLLICTAVFMATFSAIAARIGCVIPDSLLGTIATHYGGWLAVLLGMTGWLVAAGFQFGNNMGVSTAMKGLIPQVPVWIWPPLFTVASIGFLFGARRVYRILEWLMIVLVCVMILAFVANLLYTSAGVLGELWESIVFLVSRLYQMIVDFLTGHLDNGLRIAGQLLPHVPRSELGTVQALVATTFSIVAAFAQAYLVQEKKWGILDYKTGIRDAWLGIGILGMMTLTIMLSAAGVFADANVELNTADDVARQLEGIFGAGARYIFCLGLAAAAFSSFVANAMIGGILLADGLRLGRSFDSVGVKTAASAALLVGMTVALLAVQYKASMVGSIIVAQAMTLLVAPLCGIFLLVVANSPTLMGKHRIRWMANILAIAGLLVVLWMTWRTAQALPAKIEGLLQGLSNS